MTQGETGEPSLQGIKVHMIAFIIIMVLRSLPTIPTCDFVAFIFKIDQCKCKACYHCNFFFIELREIPVFQDHVVLTMTLVQDKW